MTLPSETLSQELTRLVYEYQSSEEGSKEEAWNLIADFTVENWLQITGALQYTAIATANEQLHTEGADGA